MTCLFVVPSHLRPVGSYLLRFSLAILLLGAAREAAADATWKLQPVSNSWGLDQNWTPETHPYGLTETATFDASNVTGVIASGYVGRIVFTPTASAYTFNVTTVGVIAGDFGIMDVGIVNLSPHVQKFVLPTTSTHKSILTFAGNATAGVLTEFRARGALSDVGPARITFESTSNAGSGNFIAEGGSAATKDGAMVDFFGNASAAQGTFTVRGGEVTQGRGAVVSFLNSSSAGSATFEVRSGTSSLGGILNFWDSSSAGAAQIFNRCGVTNEETPGMTRFNFSASAGTSTITNDGRRSGPFAQAVTTTFGDNATAGQASITNRAAIAAFGLSGRTSFYGNTQAAGATITNEGATIADAPGGTTLFYSNSGSLSAGTAVIINQGASNSGGGGGSTVFQAGTAAQATITNEAGSNGGVGGTTDFVFTGSPGTRAGSATIINQAPTSAVVGGVTTFRSATAETATLTAEGSAVAGDSAVIFKSSNADRSTITLMGATAPGGKGGRLLFQDSGATAGQARLIARSGTMPNAPGGRIIFQGPAQGGTARAELEAGALMDISGLTSAAMDIGAIIGSGDVFLGGKNLRVGSNNADALFSGVVRDGGLVAGTGGSLTKIGSGTFTFAGNNTYTGATTVSSGTLCVSGSVAGNVIVNSAASLCLSGGTLGSAGSTVTVSANGNLNGFGVINGSFTNNGVVDSQGSGTLTLTGAVTNNGVMRIRRGAVLDAGSATSFINNGTLDVITGSVTLPPNFSNGSSGVVLDSSLVRVKGVNRSGEQLTVQIDGYSGHSYQLQRSDSLVPSSFRDIGVAQPGQTGQTLSFSTTLEGEAHFYRVRVD